MGGRTDGDATDVTATTERVYGVGHFDHGVPDKSDPCLRHVPVSCPNGTPHRKLIAYDAGSGQTDAGFTTQANTDTGPYVAIVGAHHLFVGGDFTEVGPAGDLRPQGGFAAFDQIAQPGPVPPTPHTLDVVDDLDHSRSTPPRPAPEPRHPRPGVVSVL